MDYFKSKLSVYEKLFTSVQLEDMKALIEIIEKMSKANNDLGKTIDDKVKVDQVVELHLQEILNTRACIIEKKQRHENFKSRNHEIKKEIANKSKY